MEGKQEKMILIADYGRSGQGWLSFMLSYILNAKYVEPYDLLKGRWYSSSNQYVINLSQGNLPNRQKTKYSMVIKTHEYPARDFNLTDKVIFLTRDPRDVAVSAYYRYRLIMKTEKSRNFKERIANLINRFRFTSYIFTIYKWEKYYKAWKTIGYHFVRYEDLSLDTKKALKSILDYLEVAIDEKLIEEAIEKFSFEKMSGHKKGDECLNDQDFRKGVIGDYKNNFSNLDLEIFKIICGKEAREAGYEF